MPMGPHRKSTASMTRCQFFRAVPLDDFFALRSRRGSCRDVWLPRARGGQGSELGLDLLGGAEECSSMLVSDWFSVDARRDTGGDAMRGGAMLADIGCARRGGRRSRCRQAAVHAPPQYRRGCVLREREGSQPLFGLNKRARQAPAAGAPHFVAQRA